MIFGAGLLAALVGVMVALPLAVRPLAALIGTPLKLRGMPGELAKQNALRNPRRTSSTAAALMIGLTLVVSMGVFASSLKASFGDVISDQTNADLYLSSSSAQGPGFSPSVIDCGQGRRRRGQGLGRRLGPGTLRQRRHELLRRRPGHGRRGHEPRGLTGFGRRPRQGRGDGVEDDRDGQGLEAGRRGSGGVRRVRQAPAARGGDLRRQGLDQRQLRDQPRRAERLRRARSSSPRAWSPSPPAPTRRTSRRPSRPPWPTTRTPRCWTRRASRRRPVGSSATC